MSRTEAASGRVSVIVAAIDAKTTVRASLEGFAGEMRGRGEVVLVDASRDGTADAAERLAIPGVRVLRRPPGMLAPELWREGLNATDAPLVAFSTAQMVPNTGWLDALTARLEETGAAAAGGPIEPASGLNQFDRAVYLLRYLSYQRPLPDRVAVEPPGDNSLYVRDRLTGLERLWTSGFWETEVLRALRTAGDALAMADDAAVVFQGGTRPASVAGQRHLHACHYGAQRAARMALSERLARTASAPAVPFLMLGRMAVALAARQRPIGPCLPAVPWLALLLAAWASGEARGTWLGRPRARAQPS
jgi:hypothetical protein